MSIHPHFIFSVLAVLFISPIFITSLLSDDNFCRKCKVMDEYHRNNPSKYTYYDDYLKDVEEKGEDAVNPRFEDLPEDVQRIVDPERRQGIEQK